MSLESSHQGLEANIKPAPKPWTKKDVALMLRHTREGLSKKAIADTLGRNPKSVSAKFQSLVKAGKIKVCTQVKTMKAGAV
jgi:DNA-binding NarL/FixJ family response regulator